MTEEIRFRDPVAAAGFAQIMHVITRDEELSDGAYRLYALYLGYAQQSGRCWPSRETVADILGKSESTVSRLNDELIGLGYITRDRRLGRNSLTWIENPSNIPRLKERSEAMLEERESSSHMSQKCDVDVSKIGHASSQKQDAHEEEPIEEEPDQQEPAALETSSLFEEDLEREEHALWRSRRVEKSAVHLRLPQMGGMFRCPECDESCEWPTSENKRRKALSCPHCETPFVITSRKLSDRAGKEKVYRGTAAPIGKNLLCFYKHAPEQEFPFSDGEYRALLDFSDDILARALDWACRKRLLDSWSEDQVAARILSACATVEANKPTLVSVPEPKPRSEISIEDWPMEM